LAPNASVRSIIGPKSGSHFWGSFDDLILK
jgi:hypothetical protein